MVLLDIMCSDILHRLYGESFATDLNLVAFHGFLDGSAHIAHAYIYTRCLSAISHCPTSLSNKETLTLIPVLVASLTAFRRLS